MISFTPRTGDALLIVDMQNDFLPGGSLAVPQGDTLLPDINDLAHKTFDAVIATQDWHPAHHCSFSEQGGQWPSHCVAGSQGAALHADLDTAPISHIVHKGMRHDAECYSAFADEHGRSTGLTGLLTGIGIRRVILCGVALDYCVSASALDSLHAGFETCILRDLSRAIDDPTPLLHTMSQEGIVLL